MPHASGSCRVAVHNGSHVLVGIKVQVQSMDISETPEEDAPIDETMLDEEMESERDVGKIICRVDWYPFKETHKSVLLQLLKHWITNRFRLWFLNILNF